MTLGSLFSGIGGFELAATWAGIKPIWSNEIDSFCCKVLRKNFDHEIIEKDIRYIGKYNLKSVDIITAGVPCQPASIAGNRKGKSDDRWLWDEAIRVISELKPTYIICENPPGILSLENGKPFDEILFALENEGYTIELFNIPACSIGAWHRRERIWIIAYSDAIRNKREARKNEKESKKNGLQKRNEMEQLIKPAKLRIPPYFNEQGLQKSACTRKQSVQSQAKASQGGKFSRANAKKWDYWKIEPNVVRMVYGVSQKLVKDRRKRIIALGNSIVPQIAVELFKVIKEYEKSIS